MRVFRNLRAGSEEMKTDSGHEDDSHIRILGSEENENASEERPMTVEEATACLPAEQVEELRILIKVGCPVFPTNRLLIHQVDIIVATQNLSDTFEWDLNSNVTPDEFAHSYVKELGLSGEFA